MKYSAFFSYKALRKLAASCLLFALAVFPAIVSAQIGYVHEVTGVGSIQKPASKSSDAQPGDTFEPGTVFMTGSGTVTLKFADGQVLVLSPDSILRVGRYRYAEKSIKQSASLVVLEKGEMRFITGAIGAEFPEGIRITSGKSDLSVLKPGGADFIVRVNPEPEEVGLVAVAKGEIGVRTPYGKIEKIEATKFAPWQPGRALLPAAPIASAPAVLQATMTSQFATVVPGNTPVNVASAAFAATFTSFVALTTNPPQTEIAAGPGKFSLNELAVLLAALPATAAGPIQQVAVVSTGEPPLGYVPPAVTSGGGGRCTGSGC